MKRAAQGNAGPRASAVQNRRDMLQDLPIKPQSTLAPPTVATGQEDTRPEPAMRHSLAALACAIVACGLLIAAYQDSLRFLLSTWLKDDNYSHGVLVPFISAYLIWIARQHLVATPITGTGWGLLVMGAATGLYVLGELTTIYALLHVSFVLQLIGVFLCLQGTARAAIAAFPLGYLFSALPLPSFLYQAITGHLQLWSSSLGILFLQLVGVTAFQEGNVIDLGSVQLQVVEACSGLRYLFPLVSLSLLTAYLLNDAWWKRVVVVLSSVPIAIVLNGFRIAVVGVLVEHSGASAADGAMHLLEGWLLFLISIAALGLEVWVLRRVGHRTLLTPAPQATTSAKFQRAPVPTYGVTTGSLTFIGAALALTACLYAVSTQLTEREDRVPVRQSFLDFPPQVGPWQAQTFPLEERYLRALKLDDYYLADYSTGDDTGVNVYLAYYQSQRKGQSAHSPKSCIPGGGWEISSFTTESLPSLSASTEPLSVNRVLIQRQADRQLVYYWFKQRDRSLANEYLVKWFLLWDGLVRHRTDGALIRLVTPIGAREPEAAADARLQAMTRELMPLLNTYIPN